MPPAKPKREVSSFIHDDAKVAAWGDNHAMLALGRNCVLVSAAADTIARAGDGGVIALTWFENRKQRWRVSVGYVGQDLKPNTWYKLNKKGEFVETKV